MNLIDDAKASRKIIPSSDKNCFTVSEIAIHLGFGEAAARRMIQKKLDSGEWEFAGEKRNAAGFLAKAYRLVKQKNAQ